MLHNAGFSAFLAGGCVRDALLGRHPKDYDVATDATPETVRKVFGKRNTLAFGSSFGVIGVLPEKSAAQASGETLLPTEVATFRSDGEYSDGRRPDSVHYGNAQQDALRRDFTINGMFYDSTDHCVIDFVGGRDDLRDGILHTIGDPHQRFDEDKLRMLRAVRFATTLGFSLTPETKQAIIEHASTIAMVSGERIGAEMRRIMQSPAAIQGVQLLSDVRLIEPVFPEWMSANQELAAKLLSNLSEPTFTRALACVLLATPDGSLSRIANRWKLSNEEQREINAAIALHETVIRAESLPWSKVQPVLTHRDVASIIAVAQAVASGRDADLAGVNRCKTALSWEPQRLDPPPLINGNDLADLGYRPGPTFAKALRAIRDAQLNGVVTSREEAIQMAASTIRDN